MLQGGPIDLGVARAAGRDAARNFWGGFRWGREVPNRPPIEVPDLGTLAEEESAYVELLTEAEREARGAPSRRTSPPACRASSGVVQERERR